MKIALALLVAGIFGVVPATALTSTAPPRIAFSVGATSGQEIATTAPDESDFAELSHGTQDADPSWSPDGTRIAFDGRPDASTPTEISAMNADGTGQKRLTNDSSLADGIANTQPVWSPRGDLIAFLKYRAQSYDVWVMRPDGSRQWPLTADGNSKRSVSWSPDGSRLVYIRTEGSGSRIYTVGIDGSPPRVLSPAGAFDIDPAWSPDGSKIAFSAPALTVMNADGSGRRALTEIATSAPAWSPDGSSIAFTGFRPFPRYGSRFGIPFRQDVFVVDADGGDPRRLTGPFADDAFDGPFAAQPTWWPDGSRLFYVSQRYPSPQTAFVVNADGTCEKQFFGGVIGTPALLRPVWQPGGGPLPTVTRCAELRLSVSIPKTTVALTEPAVWTFTIDNDGNVAATGVKLEVGVGASVATVIQSVSPGCLDYTTSVVCYVDRIGPGKSASLTIQGSRDTAGAIRLGDQVSADEFDTDLTNNSTFAGADVLRCTQVGTYRADVIYGTPGPDRICALPGADEIYAGKGNDSIDAGNGDDRIYPGPGRDTVIAKGGDDVIEARDGERDWIDCGAGHDIAVVDRADVTRHCEVVARPPA